MGAAWPQLFEPGIGSPAPAPAATEGGLEGGLSSPTEAGRVESVVPSRTGADAAHAVFDVVAEVRLRWAHRDATAVLVEQRPYVAGAAVAALAEVGIPAYARNTGVRALLSFFGPFAPIEVLVPGAAMARARERLAAILEPE